jgi:hypothetical protein
VPLPQTVIAAIRRYLRHRGSQAGPLFLTRGQRGKNRDGRLETRSVLRIIRELRQKVGLHVWCHRLFSRCMGGVSTFAAMTRFPEAFDGVRCLVSPQPVTHRYIVQRRLALLGLGDRLDDFDTLIRLNTSVGLKQRVPQEWAKHVHVPTFLYQVRHDSVTDPSDVQPMYENIPMADKKLQWIEGTTARWDGYLEFQRRPESMLEWFDQHMS